MNANVGLGQGSSQSLMANCQDHYSYPILRSEPSRFGPTFLCGPLRKHCGPDMEPVSGVGGTLHHEDASVLRRNHEMQLIKITAALGLAFALSGCLQNDAQRGVAGAASVTCHDLGVSACRNEHHRRGY